MKYLIVAAGLLLLSSPAALAALTASDLQEIGLTPSPGAHVTLDSRWIDDRGASISIRQAMQGQATVLVFADYTCRTLCGPVLSFAADALAKSGLSPQEYRLVVLGIDPKDGPGDAAEMKRARIGNDAVASAAVFLTSDENTIRATARAVGYRFSYDAAHDQFAHPAAALVLTADGRVTRVLSGLGLSANDIRLALVEAGQGRTGTFSDHIRLLCYGFDPSIGIYTVSIYRGLAIASGISVVMLAAGIGWLSLRPPRLS